jgi:hypothetical protein
MEVIIVNILGSIGAGSCRTQDGKGLTVEMVVMLVGDEDDVGLGIDRVVGHRLRSIGDRVYLYLQTVVLDSHTGVLDARNLYFFTILGSENVSFLGSDSV